MNILLDTARIVSNILSVQAFVELADQNCFVSVHNTDVPHVNATIDDMALVVKPSLQLLPQRRSVLCHAGRCLARRARQAVTNWRAELKTSCQNVLVRS